MFYCGMEQILPPSPKLLFSCFPLDTSQPCCLQFAPAQINNLLEMSIFVSLESQTWLYVAPVMWQL